VRANDLLKGERSSLGRADLILRAFDTAHSSLSLSGIIARTSLPKTTAYRVTEKMVELGWLEHQEGRYVIGNRLFDLATLAGLRLRLREATLPVMQDLYEVTREAVHLSVLEDDHILTLDMIMRAGRSTASSRLGGRLPAHCTAVGKVLLAFAQPEVVKLIMRSGLPPRTPRTITVGTKLRSELARVRSEGIAYDHEEWEVGRACVAAPVTSGDACAAAISIFGDSRQLQLERLAPTIRVAALTASRALRHIPRP
jgi:Transcriptional regulator